MIPPTSIDGTDITGATIDGQDVQEITVDGQTVFTAVPELPTSGLLHQWDFSQATTLTNIPDQFGSVPLDGGNGGDSFTTLNGLQAVETDGTNGFFETSSLAAYTNDRRIFFAVSVNDFTNFGHLMDGVSNKNYVFLNSNNSLRMFDLVDTPNNVISANQTFILGIIIESTGKIRVDGVQQASGSSTIKTISNLRLGKVRNGISNREVDGIWGEVLMYTGSGATNSQIETYLADKWGVTI